MPQLTPALISRRNEHKTLKQWGAVQAIDLSLRVVERGGIRFWECHPKAVQAAYELICHFDSNMPVNCLPDGSGGVKITIPKIDIYVKHLEHYSILPHGTSIPVLATSFQSALKKLGLS